MEVAPPGSRHSVFRRDGEFWTVVFEGKTVRLKHSKGMDYLAFLLARPGRESHAAEIVGAGVIDATDAGPALDEHAKLAYRSRLSVLAVDLDEARRYHDPVRAERVQAEIDAITDELTAAVGIGGRDRRVGSASERARVAATRGIRSALDRISHPIPFSASTSMSPSAPARTARTNLIPGLPSSGPQRDIGSGDGYRVPHGPDQQGGQWPVEGSPSADGAATAATDRLRVRRSRPFGVPQTDSQPAPLSADSVPYAGSVPVRRRTREFEWLAGRDRRARPGHVFMLTSDDAGWLSGNMRVENRLGAVVQLCMLPWLGSIPDGLTGARPPR